VNPTGSTFPARPTSGRSRWTLSAVLLASLLLSHARAEGSRDLLGSGPNDYRASMETGYGNGILYNVPRKTTLYVYAKVGEQLALGTSAMGVGAAAINVYTLNGTATVAAFSGAACGLIQNRAQEALGPATAYPGGYTPCLYPVTTAGIYRVEMFAPSNTATNPPARLVSSGWTTPVGAGEATLAAWDVSVLSAAATEQKGRVYAKYMALNVGNNSIKINLGVYAQTRDGYLYKVQQFIDPYGFIFFANNKGVKLANGNPSYASSSGTGFTSPADPDSSTEFTAKLFLNAPDPSIPATSGGEWLLPATATLPPTPANLSFTGVDGTANYAGSSSGYTTGGTFTFTNPGSTPFAYRLTVPLSSNGTNIDRVLLGTASPGSTSVTWDGLDGNGNPVAAGNTSYVASVKLFGGEIHFPMIDVENSAGLTITRQNLAGSGDADPSLIYWDDRPLPQTGGPTTPLFTRKGVSSTTPTHVFGDNTGTGFGNNQVIDTYSYYPSGPTNAGSGLTVRSADIQIVKTAVSTGAPLGHATRYTLDIKNNSATPGPVQTTVTDALPAWASAMTWTCPAGCAATSGTGSLSTLVTLSGTTPVRINVSLTTSASRTVGETVINTGVATHANDAVDPITANNTSSVNLSVRAPVTSVNILKQQRNVTRGGAFTATNMNVSPGETVQYRLTYTATGDTFFPSTFSVRDGLVPQLTPAGTATLTCPNGTTATVTPTGQNYIVNLVPICGAIQAGDTGTLVITATVR